MAAAAKLLIVASTAAGLLVQAWLGSREWAPLLPLTIGALVAGYALVRVFPVWGWAPLLIAAYIYPAIFHATREFFTFSYYAIWLAGLLGGILAAAHPAHWHLPASWRLPLAFWALILALGWPLIAFREMNFMWGSLDEYTLANSGLGGPPAVIIVTMLAAVLPQIAGILWFDAMSGAFAERDPWRFRRAILLPLAIGLTLGSALAIYQWTIDIEFLSAHQWAYYGRAAGGLLDGNAFGALEGLWSAPALSLALTSAPLLFATALSLTLLLWAGVWATGSRMALLAALFGLAFIALAGLRGRGRSNVRRLAAVGVAVLVMAVLLATLGRFGAHERFGMDPISRVAASLPAPNREALEKFVEFEFWNRFGPFGTASVRMIKDSPIVGVGAGTFETIYPDYAYVVTNGATRSHFDNAQSWYRHQLAELGVFGSLGWILWGAAFAAFVWRAAPARDGLVEATGVKAAIAALALISLVSMPTRNIFVSLSFWVFAFWLVKVSGDVERPRWLARLADRRAGWGAVWMLALVFVAASAVVGESRLRPPHRAMMAHWDYVNGVSRPVDTDEGIVRYTDERGVAVFYAVPGAFLKLAFQLAHEDAASSPVHVQLLQGDVQVAHFVIADRGWREIYIKVPEGQPDRMLLQTIVDRPATRATVPARGLILKDWEFVANPPQGAMVATAAR